ncbi:PREDICTED: F-box protein At1g49990-like [Camelina sativa]|uniref:F-box protein At1g49990-like n=1 Tax=Camelina sativa TaxID=90675 RepID=A0ABM0X1Y5_CAMSA|nr:PREDICTED: F-box protein At1g49990-like [Camelina sativa]
METVRRTIPEALLVEILARLPVRSIARFKSVCKRWKSVIESDYIRRLFVSLHRHSSSSWSLMFRTEYCRHITQPIGFHGCETWDLPKSLVSYIMPFQRYPNLPTSEYYFKASSNGLIWIDVFLSRNQNMVYSYKSFVGNPVLQQWVEIPPAPDPWAKSKIPWYQNPFSAVGMVTRVEHGIVSSFKMVRTIQMEMFDRKVEGMYLWRVCVYSSETGLWTIKKLFSTRAVGNYGFDSLNGVLYMWDRFMFCNGPGVLIAHDFYGPEADDQCQIIPLPGVDHKKARRCLTTSVEDVIFIEAIYRRLSVWRLNNEDISERWQLIWEINMPSVVSDVNCFPLAMNPFDSGIVYLWLRQDRCLASGNLRTEEFIVHQESDDWSSSSEGDCCRINNSDTAGHLEEFCNGVVMLSQFVLPRWMDSVPQPPT